MVVDVATPWSGVHAVKFKSQAMNGVASTETPRFCGLVTVAVAGRNPIGSTEVALKRFYIDD